MRKHSIRGKDWLGIAELEKLGRVAVGEEMSKRASFLWRRNA